MKLYDGGRAPNPRRVRIFLAEKGVSVPLVPVDMGNLEHRGETITRLNPLQRLPVLELDDGTVIAESVAIGRGALSTACVEMWQRRVEFGLFMAVAAAFRHLHPAMKTWEVPQIPEWGEANKVKALEFLAFLDRELAGRPFIAGDHFTIADITGLVAVQFMKPAHIELPQDLDHVRRWYDEVAARPSASA